MVRRKFFRVHGRQSPLAACGEGVVAIRIRSIDLFMKCILSVFWCALLYGTLGVGVIWLGDADVCTIKHRELFRVE